MLLHESKNHVHYNRKLQPYSERKFHVQNITSSTIMGYLVYIHNHDKAEEELKQKQKRRKNAAKKRSEVSGWSRSRSTGRTENIKNVICLKRTPKSGGARISSLEQLLRPSRITDQREKLICERFGIRVVCKISSCQSTVCFYLLLFGGK